MKIFFWPASSEDGCFKYRIEMQRDTLLDRGHEVATSHFLSPWGRAEADVIVGQRVAAQRASWLFQEVAKERRANAVGGTVFEVDDDLMAIDPRHNAFAWFFKEPGVRENLADNMRTADMVTVSTGPLADAVRRFNPNPVVLPNSFRSSIFDVPVPTRRGTEQPIVVVGWQGSSTHEQDWALIRPAVAQVLDETEHRSPTVMMRFLGTPYTSGLDLARLSFQPWTTDLTRHYRRVIRFDVGLAPLVDTTFNRSKSALKFMEGAALGVPMICSDVHAYRDMVVHGETGFLARDRDDWLKYLRQLVASPQLRTRIGDNAREAARAWVIEDRIKLWEDAYASLKP